MCKHQTRVGLMPVTGPRWLSGVCALFCLLTAYHRNIVLLCLIVTPMNF